MYETTCLMLCVLLFVVSAVPVHQQALISELHRRERRSPCTNVPRTAVNIYNVSSQFDVGCAAHCHYQSRGYTSGHCVNGICNCIT
ncbi:hypothetical protein J6590_065005 [Homalodisca vitripennis]|nr:hypothetical protein J6590_065005 [Homalodisca vitripennis]